MLKTCVTVWWDAQGVMDSPWMCKHEPLNKMPFPRMGTLIVMVQEAGEDFRGGIVTG